MNTIKYFFAFIIAGWMVSCNNNTIDSESAETTDAAIKTNDNTMAAEPEFNIKNGVLYFSSRGTMAATLDYLNKLSPDDLLSWSEQYGINTQKALLDKIAAEEIKLDELFSTMTEDELKNLPEDQYHSALYKEMLAKSIICEMVYSDNETGYDLAVCDPIMSAIINEDGLFVVENDLYYMDKNFIKKWENGDPLRFNEIKSAVNDDAAKGIYILYDNRTSLRAYTPPVNHMDKNDDIVINGQKYRVRLYVHCGIFARWAFPGWPNEIRFIQYKYYVRMTGEKKGLLQWNYQTISMCYEGEWTTSVTGYPYGGLQTTTLTNTFHAYYCHSAASNVYLGISLWGDGTFYHDNEQGLSMYINGSDAVMDFITVADHHYASLAGKDLNVLTLKVWQSPDNDFTVYK